MALSCRHRTLFLKALLSSFNTSS